MEETFLMPAGSQKESHQQRGPCGDGHTCSAMAGLRRTLVVPKSFSQWKK